MVTVRALVHGPVPDCRGAADEREIVRVVLATAEARSGEGGSVNAPTWVWWLLALLIILAVLFLLGIRVHIG